MESTLELTTADARVVVVSSALELAKRQAPSIGDRFRDDRPNGIDAETDQMSAHDDSPEAKLKEYLSRGM